MRAALPNLLTASRIAAIPLIAALALWPGGGARGLACAVFVVVSLTDLLDGFLARTWRVESALGRMFDPIADKMLVAAVLFVLAGSGDLAGWTLVPAAVIVLRELLVAGLREHLAERRIGLPVTAPARWKTATQMAAVALLLLGDAAPPFAGQAGAILLWTAAALSAWTGGHYLRRALGRLPAAAPAPAGTDGVDSRADAGT